MSLVITGATLADGSALDFAVVDGRIAAASDAPSDAERVDAAGLVALPGLVDLHTHLREPGKEDAETVASGTRAAARGGYTAVFAMPNLTPATDTAEAAQYVAELGRRDGHCEVVPIGAVTKGRDGVELAELGLMAEHGVRVFSDDGACVHDSLIMRRALTYLKPYDGVVAQHAQDPRLAGPSACCHESEVSGRLGLPAWPSVAESVIIARDVQLAEFTGGRYHACHISTAESVDIIRWAKKRGKADITAEVTPHHLLLDTPHVESFDTTYKVNPPLRTNEHIEALREALVDGTIDIVGTDHAPHTQEDKDHPFDVASPGMLGLEEALAVVMELFVSTGRMDWASVVDRMSTAPARIGRLPHQGRPVAVGEPANLVLVDPSRRATVDRSRSASKSRNNPYHGLDLPDPVQMTVWAGKVTFRR
ncbi:dihydroorotase [Propioniciclava sp. MC1595]|uniref:dihydroorotase n=1 Tax=Propioniciclava sp. MC1595 TaxID=2760308 RepID=UPI001662617E|nr:dihydroorotase [Propioniciclava sp. MC1595]MBB1493777.1 dihydroorotase [Propioniciclava sp. MC1595]NLE17519.1 dihydroorotase [Propioniciclava sp.]QTE25023.1 dihydroorotase [Propioniciclava sp. MC1595]